MGELSKLPNLGKELERQLNEVGITTADQLIALGAQQAWLKIRAVDPSACIHRLYCLLYTSSRIRRIIVNNSK